VSRLGGTLRGGDYHIESSWKSFQLLFDLVRDSDGPEKIFQALSSQVLVGLFASAEDYLDLDLISFFQKFFSLVFLEFQVVVIRPYSDPDAFDIEFFLLGFVLSEFAGFLVLEFSEIHDLEDRGLGGRGNFDQIQFFLFSYFQGFKRRHYSQLFAFFSDYPGLVQADSFIHSGLGQSRSLGPSKICSSYGFSINY
jgi:hypothetical protein